MMIDSHAHLYFDRFDEDRDAVIENARRVGVHGVINIGIDLPTSVAAIELARQHPGFHAAAGIHPTTPVDDLETAISDIRDLARGNPDTVVAIGEIGLDFYWKEISPAAQYPKLVRQLTLARELSLPVILHCRDALAELFDVLDAESDLPPGVFHCFSGGADDARRALDLGFHVSFAGNLTFAKSTLLREAAAAVPPEKLLLETDAPFLSPQPVRGKRNEPAHVVHTRDCLAKLHGLDAEILGEMAAATTTALFGLD